MTLAVIAATALAAQAAVTIQWTPTIFNPINGTPISGFANNGTLMWLFSVNEGFGAGGFDGLFDPSGAGALAGGTDMTGDLKGNSYTAFDGFAVMSALTWDADLADVNGKWFAVVAWDPTTPGNYGIEVFKITGATETGSAWDIGTELGIGSITIGPATGVVPEPLTVGLALAGVALLIAQRKRK